MVSHGSPKGLSDLDVATVITFALEKSFIADYMQTYYDSFFTFNERSSFRRTLDIPGGTHIWIGKTPPGRGVFKASRVEMPPNTPNRFEIHVFTISIGQLVIQTATSRWYKKSRRRHESPPMLTQNIIWSNSSVRIFPNPIFPVAWPPRFELSARSLDEYIKRWGKLEWRT
jgi:hypothetical protein